MTTMQKSRNQRMRQILTIIILCFTGAGCNFPLSVLLPKATPLPGWRIPTDYLFLTEKDLPEGWQLDFPGPTPEPDPTINLNARKFYKVGSSVSVYQTIWRSYTINDAQEFYADRRTNGFRTPQPPIPENRIYCEFKPPAEIVFKSEVADELYLACGTWDSSYCKVLARYRNYVTILRIDMETECNGEYYEGLTYLDAEQIIRAMDSHFVKFLRENPIDSP